MQKHEVEGYPRKRMVTGVQSRRMAGARGGGVSSQVRIKASMERSRESQREAENQSLSQKPQLVQ